MNNSISGAEIKRQILGGASKSVIATKMRRDHENPHGRSDGEYIGDGKDLEALITMPGWVLVEEFMIRRMDLVGMVQNDTSSDLKRGIAKGYIELEQYIETAIRMKNEIMDKERNKYETETVQKDEES